MSFLPKLRNTSAPSKVEDIAFFGLDRTESAKSGYFSDTGNVTSRDFPFISSRPERYLSKLPDNMKCLGAYSAKELCFVLNDGSKSYFYFGGAIKGEWEDTEQKEKFFCEVGGAIYIYPDRKYYRYRNDAAIEEYKATHPRVGESGEGGFRLNFTDINLSTKNTNTFLKTGFVHEFDVGDAVAFYAFDKDSGERVLLYDLPSGVVMSGEKSFEDFYIYATNFDASSKYVMYASTGTYISYIKVEYEFTYPYSYDECFGDFSKDAISDEIYRDEELNQYLVITEKIPVSGYATINVTEKLRMSFDEGIKVHFGFANEKLRTVLPESAIVSECGIDKFYKSNNYTTKAYLKFTPDTFKVENDWESAGKGNAKEYVSFKNISGTDSTVYATASPKYPNISAAANVNNRLWGYEGNTIYASSLGKPYIMSSYRGLSTDSWSVETGIKRDFTGVIEYGSVPHFFTEDRIIKVYGDAPSSFRTSETVCSGVKNGAQKSLCVCAGVLHYLDKDGFIASYTGSYPTVISKKLNEEFKNGIFTCDERFLYCILKSKNSNKKLYVYDTQNGIWILEGNKDVEQAVCFGGEVYFFRDIFIESDGDYDTGFEKYLEVPPESVVEFPVNDEGVFNQKRLKKILLKINAEKGTSLSVEVKETESPEYTKIFERVVSEGDGVITIPISCIRTLGYSIRIKGRGTWRLEGVMRRVAIGSYKS